MKSLILPDVYCQKKLEKAKMELIAKAKAKYSNIQLCGNSKDWDDCFTGFMKHGVYIMLFSFNIGPNTYATSGEFDIWENIHSKECFICEEINLKACGD